MIKKEKDIRVNSSLGQAVIDSYLQSFYIHPILAPSQPFVETLAEKYTMKLRVVSRPPTTGVSFLSWQQASRSNRVFLIMRCLVMNIKVRLVYLW